MRARTEFAGLLHKTCLDAFLDCVEPVAQTLRSPFDGLRANGIGVENIGVFPFVLSLSKHDNGFVQQAPCRLQNKTYK